jgi:mono/diheme cytochrome c family protein
MKVLAALAVSAVLAVLLVPAPAAQPGDKEIATQAHAVLQKHCAACHSGLQSKGGMGYVLDRDKLLARGKVVAGKPDESPLWQRVADGEMPPPKRPRLSGEETAVLKRWIVAGAPAFGPALAQSDFITADAVARAALADLESVPASQRKFIRYFSAVHLANAGRDAAEVATVRLALGKLLNSLSWHPRLTVPRTVGTGLWRIDLRDYKWAASSWERLLRDYPYKDPPDKALAKATDTEVPVVRADWFVATASQPPLYYDLQQMPLTDRGLERLLQVDVAQDLADENAVRAGFNDSGVSKNNRVLERHDAAFGAYWRSYDFAGNKGRQSVFEHPLGPNNGETSFRPDGGEMIFHLPNGLLAFLIVDGLGRRIDKAPGDIVSDPLRPDQRVTAGLSCMNCHARGLLPKADQVRAHVEKNRQAFTKADVESVLALYATKDRFAALVDEDTTKYTKALATLAVKLDGDEPVNLVTRRYEAPLDLALAAAEMGTTVEWFREKLAKGLSEARAFGPLAVKGGTVAREVFEDAYATFRDYVRYPPYAEGSVMGVPPLPDKGGFGHEAGGFSDKALGAVYSGRFGGGGGLDTGVVHAVALSADGQRGAAGMHTRDLAVFNADSGVMVGWLLGHQGAVLAVAFSPQGLWLASGSADRSVRTWSMSDGQQRNKMVGHSDKVRCVAFAPDGWTLVSGSDDRSLRLWDHRKGKELRCFLGHEGPVLAVAWGPDSKWFVSAGQDGTVRRWDAATGKQLAVLEGHSGAVNAVAVSPDGSRILSGGADRTVRLWDAATGKLVQSLKGHANGVVAVAFAADGKQALSAASQYRNADPLVRLWDLESGKELRRWGESTETVTCVALSPGGRLAVSGGPSSWLQQWKLAE